MNLLAIWHHSSLLNALRNLRNSHMSQTLCRIELLCLSFCNDSDLLPFFFCHIYHCPQSHHPHHWGVSVCVFASVLLLNGTEKYQNGTHYSSKNYFLWFKIMNCKSAKLKVPQRFSSIYSKDTILLVEWIVCFEPLHDNIPLCC